MNTKQIILNEKRNVTLNAYLLPIGGEFQKLQKRPGVLILPGGAYQYCSQRESDPVAMTYASAGYHVFVLHYSVGQHAIWPNPLEDYESAMALLQQNAEDWHLLSDKIAVIGFSAGGHLAAAAATMSKHRPQAAILGYPVTGAAVKTCNPSAPELLSQVDKDTPPCFVFAARTDDMVPIDNSLSFLQALSQAGISFESHIYAYGPHGFATCEPSLQNQDPSLICRRTPHWVNDSISWLEDVLGTYGPLGYLPPVCFAHVNGNYNKTLSADCTIGYLLNHQTARSILMPLIEENTATFATDESIPNTSLDERIQSVYNLKLKDVLRILSIDEIHITQIDHALSQIPNA